MKRKSLGLVGILLAALATVLFARYLPGAGPGENGASSTNAEPRVHAVRTLPAARRVFETSVATQGNIAAKVFADVPARVFGPLDAVYVDEGDRVEAGETVLFQVDRENLERAARIAEQDLAVARHAEAEGAANLERVQADLDKATLDFERFQRLVAHQAATRETLEQVESRYRQSEAMRKHAVAVVALSRERSVQAEIALEIARKNLDDSAVTAPIGGVVTQRMSEPGEIAEPGKPVLRIEDTGALEVSAFLPAAHYAAIVPGTSTLRVAVGVIDAGEHPVSYKSPTIDPALRTFEVRCVLSPPPEGVAPGAMAQVAAPLAHEEAIGVPRDAIQTRGGQPVVFVVDGNRARQVTVTPGTTSDGWVAVSGGALAEGTPVVVAGQDMLDDGDAVSVAEGGG